MNLLQIFDFKGLHQAGRKMSPPMGYFRRFTNAYKDKTGRIMPFGKGTPVQNAPAYAPAGVVYDEPLFSAVFKSRIFQLIRGTDGSANEWGAFKYMDENGGDLDIAQIHNGVANNNLMDLDKTIQYCPAGNFSSAILNNKIFFNEYIDESDFNDNGEIDNPRPDIANLLKFDGLQVSRAGLPTPFYVQAPDAAGAKLLRFVYFSIGLDAEPVFSNYLEQKHTVGAHTVYSGGYSNYPGTPLTDAVGVAGVTSPSSRIPDDSLFDFRRNGATVPNYYNRKFVRKNGAYAFAVGTGFTVPAAEWSQGLQVGDWLLALAWTPPTSPYHAYYFKVKTLTGTYSAGGTVLFESKVKAFNINTASWEDVDLDLGPPQGFTGVIGGTPDKLSGWLLGFANIWLLPFYSNDNTGLLPFQLCTPQPMFWDTDYSASYDIGVPINYAVNPMGFITADDMAGFYDENVVKLPFPAMKGITSYQGLLVGWDAEALYFNDISLAGSSEMVSGQSFALPTGSEFGEIISCCGSENFLLISRERKNFVLRGDLATGNVSITECDKPVPGAANAKATSNAYSDKVLMMNSTGIYEIDAGAGMVDISKDIKDLFTGNPTDGNLFDKTVFKTKQEILDDSFDGGVFKIALDDTRGFILFLTGKMDPITKLITDSNVLVYDGNDGTWYEFDAGSSVTVEAINGLVYSLGDDFSIEDGVILPTGTSQLLIPHWATLGSPSLEKQVNQLVFYGKVKQYLAQARTLNIKQQNDWNSLDGGVYNTDTTYTDVTSDSQYFHKKRLDASKPKATSVILECTKGGLELEGIEIELETIQSGVK